MKPGDICSRLPNICLNPSRFCYFYGQMNCHIHAYSLPSNLFIKKEKPVESQFLLSRWVILIRLQQARFISGWNQSRWKRCLAVRFFSFLERMNGRKIHIWENRFQVELPSAVLWNALLDYGWSGQGIKIACRMVTALTHFQHKRLRASHNDRLALKVESTDSINNHGASSHLMAFPERYD